MKRYDNYSDAVEAYLSNADYLTEADAPMVTMLTLVAKELDANGSSTRLLHEFGVTFRHLRGMRGNQNQVADEAEAFLMTLG